MTALALVPNEVAFTGEVHPYADAWGPVDEAVAASMAEDIAENGQRQPCVLDAHGSLVDGRHRLRACEIAGVEPLFVVDPELVTDEEIAAFVGSQNGARYHLTPGKLAMGTALALAAQGKRRNGRWVRKSLSQNLGLAEQEAMRRAGFILDWRPDLAPRVMALGPDALALDAAYQSAKAAEDAAKADERQRELEAAQLADLRQNRPDLADLVAAGNLPLEDALIVREKAIKDEAKRLADIESRRRKFSHDLGNAIQYLAPLALYPERTAQIADDFDQAFLLIPIDHQTVQAARAALDLIDARIAKEKS